MEKEETHYEHRKYDRTAGDIEISPAPILGFVAACYAWSSDIARKERGVAFIVGKESPRDFIKLVKAVEVQAPCLLSEPRSCPRGHHTDSKVSKAWEARGRNSRNSAFGWLAGSGFRVSMGLTPSTGRFPPTPTPSAA